MRSIDLHCDSAVKLINDNMNFLSNNCAVDLSKLGSIDALVQVFAFFTDSANRYLDDIYLMTIKKIEHFKQILLSHAPAIALATSFDSIATNRSNNKISCLLAIEDGALLCNSIDRLKTLYLKGVRAITLTWNYRNCICACNGMSDGLTKFGQLVVEQMNNLGMIIDVSHLSDEGVVQVLRTSTKPIMASHSNARQIFNCSRNLNDELIKAIADKGGVIGVNYYNKFLGSPTTTFEAVERHINHLINVGGEGVVALGSDFDGYEPSGEILDCRAVNSLMHYLSKSLTALQIDKLTRGNALRLFKDTLQTSDSNK